MKKFLAVSSSVFLFIPVLLFLFCARGWTIPAKPGVNPPLRDPYVRDNGDPARRFLASVRVGKPESYKGLVLYPLYSPSLDSRSYVPMRQALDSGQVVIQEWNGGEVNQIVLQNNSKEYVFGMSGEILQGAKQDRILQQDLLIPPYSGPIHVSDFCTEEGRWTEGATRFNATEYAEPPAVRKAAPSGGQQEVWNSVAKEEARMKVYSPTSAARDIYQAPDVKTGIAQYERALKSFPYEREGSVGVAAFSGGRLLVVDLFQSPYLFRQLYPELLDSYAVDAMEGSYARYDSPGEVERMLIQVADLAYFENVPGAGSGNNLRLTTANYEGSALAFEGSILHLDLFPSRNAGVQKQEEHPDLNLQIRRENHGQPY